MFSTYQTFVTNLHHLRVELRCQLQEKLHRVTGSLLNHNHTNCFINVVFIALVFWNNFCIATQYQFQHK